MTSLSLRGIFKKLISSDSGSGGTYQFENANARLVYPIKILLAQLPISLLYINWLCLILFPKGKVSACSYCKVIDLRGGCVWVLRDILQEARESSAAERVTTNSHWVQFCSQSVEAWVVCKAQRYSNIWMVNKKGLAMKVGFSKCSRSNFKVRTPRCPSSVQRTRWGSERKCVGWLRVRWTARHWCGFLLCGVCGTSYSSEQIQPLLSKLFMLHF